MLKAIVLIALLAAAPAAFSQIPARTLPDPIPTRVIDDTRPSEPAKGQHPQARSKDELKAYQEASLKTDGPSAEAAADAFAGKYPQSQLCGFLYQHAMTLYQSAGDADKTVVLARKTLAWDPNNGPALASVASVLASHTPADDPNRQERYAEARKDAERVIALAAAGNLVPPATSQVQPVNYRQRLLIMSYSSLGTLDLSEKKYGEAENDIQKTIEVSQPNPDPISYYKLAWVQQKQGKSQDALEAAKKCVASSTDLGVTDACTTMVSALQKPGNIPPQPAAASNANPAAAAK